MRTDTISAIASILSGIKINKLTDRKAKAVLLKDYLAVRKVDKEFVAERDEIIRKFQDDWRDALADESLQDDAFKQAEEDGNVALAELASRDADVALEKVKAELLYDADLWADDILLAQIPGSIDFLVENGVAE